MENNEIILKICTSHILKNEIEQLEGIIAYKTRDHELIYGNNYLLKYNGYKSVNNIVGKKDTDLIYAEYSNIYHAQERDALEGNIYSCLHPGVDVDGRHFIFFNRKYPWIDKNKNVVGIICHSVEVNQPNLIELGVVLKNTAVYTQDQIYYLDKSPSKSKLSQREHECLFFLLRGKTAKDTAKILGISHRTVETYMDNLKEKFNCQNKSELISVAIKAGFSNIVPRSLFSASLVGSLKDGTN